MLRRALATVVALALLFGAVTLVALEGREVVVLRTRGADGAEHAIRTWGDDVGRGREPGTAVPPRPRARSGADARPRRPRAPLPGERGAESRRPRPHPQAARREIRLGGLLDRARRRHAPVAGGAARL